MKKRLSINWLVAFFAMLLCLYYMFPKGISVSLELLLFSYFLLKEEIKKNFKQRLRVKPLYWYLFFSLFLIMTNIFSIDEKTIYYLTTCINCFVFISISCLVIKDKNDVEIFVRYFGLCGFIVCVLLLPSIYQTILMGGGRMGSTIHESSNDFLNNSITLGYILMMINTCQFYIIVSTSSKWERLYVLVLFLFSLFCILLTGTRKTLLSCVICWFVYLYLNNKKATVRLLFNSIIGFFFLFLIYHVSMEVEFLYNSIGIRLEGLIGYFSSDYYEIDESTEVRDGLIKTGKRIFLDNPIFGAGIVETQRLLRNASHPHNNYLSCLDFGGIVTFVAYYWFYAKIFVRYYHLKNYSKIDNILLGLMISLLLTDYAATTYNIIFFPTFITIIYLNTLYHSCPLKGVNVVKSY